MTTWILLFYFGRGFYGPNSYTVIGHYATEQACKDMGHRVAVSIKDTETYFCIEEPKPSAKETK